MRALEVFVEVADRGSLVGAARARLLSPPTVTRIIGELEDDLGVLLLHRSTRAITLTEPGRLYLERARRLIHDYQDARDVVRGAQMDPKGVLRITASALFGQHYISPILVEFVKQYPDVSVDAVFLDRVVNLVEEGFDLAVRIGPLPDSSLIAVRVGEVRRVVCGCASYFERHGVPQTPNDLTDAPIIAARTVTPTNRWRFGQGISVNVVPRLAFSSVPAAIAAATSGWGLTRVLSYQVGPELGDSRLQTVLSEYELPPLPIHLVHAEGREASAKVRAFVEMAGTTLRNHAHLHRTNHA